MTDIDQIRIAEMDYADLTIASLSHGSGIEDLSREEAVKFARVANDTIAAAVKRYPDRFVGTICLPSPYVEESVAELERAVKVLGLKYWHTHSNYSTHYIYEEQMEPIFAKCAELDVPFYIHPTNPACEYLTDSGISFASAGFGYGVDVMKNAIRIIISGIFDPKVVLLTMESIGIDNIMLGSDYPYEDLKASVDFIKNLPISDEDKDKILYKNAEKYILKK